MNNPYIGSSLDELLEEDDLLTKVNEIATKRVLAWQLEQEIRVQNLTKTEMAERMGTSRAALNRLLNPENSSVTLDTLDRAARVVGKRIKIELVDA
ncbi:helix-turn-helix domain-containing protein [Merismopedia glauca]|nr:helix-turn-helix transcriptional regulator [Merismopedia glauca]